MAKYTAAEQSVYESSGVQGFRLEKDNDKARVIFLYEGPESIDGWACHRFQIGQKGYTVSVDCPRSKNDPIEKCPACADNMQLYTRLFVRMFNLNTNKVEIWDRASGFRTELLGMMQYFNPLYGKVYEITRHGSGLQTKYQYQSLNDSGITPEQYAEYVKECDKLTEEYVKPIDSYMSVKQRWEASKNQAAEEEVKVNNGAPAQGAWGQPQQGAWGNQAPAPQQGWGQAPPQGYTAPPAPQTPQAPPQQGWGQAPQQPPQAPPTQAPQAAPQAPQQGWGQAPAPQAPTQNWGQAPQNWGTNQ